MNDYKFCKVETGVYNVVSREDGETWGYVFQSDRLWGAAVNVNGSTHGRTLGYYDTRQEAGDKLRGKVMRMGEAFQPVVNAAPEPATTPESISAPPADTRTPAQRWVDSRTPKRYRDANFIGRMVLGAAA